MRPHHAIAHPGRLPPDDAHQQRGDKRGNNPPNTEGSGELVLIFFPPFGLPAVRQGAGMSRHGWRDKLRRDRKSRWSGSD